MLKIIINLKIIYISLSVLSMILFYKLYYEKEKDIKSNWYDVNSSFTNLLLNWGPSYFFLQLRSRHSWTVFFNFFTFLSPQSFVHLRQKYFEQLTFKIFSTINILFGANSSRQSDSLSIHSNNRFYEWEEKELIWDIFIPSWLAGWLCEVTRKCFPKQEVPEHLTPCPGEPIWSWEPW